MQSSFNKYGEKYFVFEILHQIEVNTRNELYIFEDSLINSIENSFNIVKVSGRPPKYSELTNEQREYHVQCVRSALTGRKWTAEQLAARQKYKCTEETRKLISKNASLRRWSTEQKQMLSDSHKGKILTEDHKVNIRDNNGKTKYRGTIIINEQGEELVLLTGIPTFAKKNGFSRSSLQCLISGKLVKVKGWKVKN